MGLNKLCKMPFMNRPGQWMRVHLRHDVSGWDSDKVRRGLSAFPFEFAPAQARGATTWFMVFLCTSDETPRISSVAETPGSGYLVDNSPFLSRWIIMNALH